MQNHNANKMQEQKKCKKKAQKNAKINIFYFPASGWLKFT